MKTTPIPKEQALLKMVNLKAAFFPSLPSSNSSFFFSPTLRTRNKP